MAADSIGDVLRELRELRGEVGKMATAADLQALRGEVAKLTGEVETLGRETRREWADLRRDLPAEVVKAVGPQLRRLREDVDELKAAG